MYYKNLDSINDYNVWDVTRTISKSNFFFLILNTNVSVRISDGHKMLGVLIGFDVG